MKKQLLMLIFAGCLLLGGCSGAPEQNGKRNAPETEQKASAVYQASDYIELGQYRNLLIKESEIQVPESDIDTEISAILKEYQEAEEITDRGIEKGDVVNINSRGYIDGQELDTLKALSFDLLVGSGDFGTDYEEQLIGVYTGETKEFNVEYPEDYASENLAGKVVHYVVKVNMIVHYLEQELTDEYVTSLTESEYTTVEEFRQGCADMLREENREKYVLAAAKQKILEDSFVRAYPQDALEKNMEEIREFYENGANYLNITLDEYLKTISGTDLDSENSIRNAAERTLDEELMLKAIAEREKMLLTDEEYAGYAETYIEENALDMTVEELENIFGKEELKEALLLKKTSEFIIGQVTVKE